jgi:Zn-dependent protease with chaperone function
MPFLLLLFLTWVCLPEKWDAPWEPFASPWLSAGLTWLVVALVAGFAWVITHSVKTRLAGHAAEREQVLRRYSRLRTYHVFALLGGYALALYLFGWGWVVQGLGPALAGEAWHDRLLPGAELLILAPFFLGLVLSWCAFYGAERALHDASEPAESPEPFWSRGAYVVFHLRQNLALVFAPVSLLLVLKGLGRLVPEGKDALWAHVVTVFGILMAVSVVLGMPWLLRLALALKPMPAGPLRDRLEATARRLKFRCSNILIWHTRNGVANAMVAGIIPWVRYVILTDRLISDLTPEEVEAVFGHEMGHARHHHMLYYLGFLAGSLFLVGCLFKVLANYFPFLEQDVTKPDTMLQSLPLVAMIGAYVFVVFGFLSRRCERQADVYGCRAVSCARADCRGHDGETPLAPAGRGLCSTGIRTFIEALEKVARLNGIPREKPGLLSSWQHSTIARRVGFLQDVLADRTLERHFQRRVAQVKWGLFLGLGLALGVLYVRAATLEHQADHDSPAAISAKEPLTPDTAGHTVPSE